MELQKVNGQQELTTKQNTVNFVHKVTDMAIRVFSMLKAAEKIKEELATEEKKEKRKVESAEQKLKEMNSYLIENEWEYKDHYSTYWKFSFEDGMRIGWFPTVICILGLVISMGIFLSDGDLAARIVADSFIAAYALFLLIFHTVYIINYLVGKRRKLSSLQSIKDKIKQASEDLKRQEDEYNSFLNATFANGLKRIEELNMAANEIDEMLSKCYALNIVKPDYQNLICLLILDNIFMNDKADTMREAMLLCDAELRHNELVGKLNEVVRALHTLSKRLQGLDRVMNSIDANISRVSQEAIRMADVQEQISYATESIQKSAENTDFFIAQHRAGAL